MHTEKPLPGRWGFLLPDFQPTGSNTASQPVLGAMLKWRYRFNEQAFVNGGNMVTETLIAESKAYRDLLAFLSLPDAEIVLGMEPTTISFENGTWTVKRDLQDPNGFTVIGQTNNMYEAMKIALH